MQRLAVFSVVLVCLGSAHGYGSGAPKDACGDMVPQHHTPPQTSLFPYALTISGKKIVKAGEKVTLRVTPNDKSVTDFQGFFVQARVGDTPVGKFSPGNDIKLVNCGSGRENAATHSNPKAKTEVVLQWTAPPNLSESVTFYVTVAQNGGVFWVKQPTQTIVVKK